MMDRLRNTDLSATPPTPPQGTTGYPKNESTPGANDGSKFHPYYLHMFAEELRAVIASVPAPVIPPDFTVLDQLNQAIDRKIAAATAAATPAASETAAGLIKIAPDNVADDLVDATMAICPASLGWVIASLISGTLGTLRVSSGAIEALTAGNVLHVQKLGPVATNAITAAKVIEMTMVRGGTVRVSFQLRTEDSGIPASGQIYKNGAAYGTLRSTTSTIYVTFSQDLAFAAEDTIELWMTGGGGAFNAVTANFKISAAQRPLTTVAMVIP